MRKNTPSKNPPHFSHTFEGETVFFFSPNIVNMDVFRHPCMCLIIYLGGWHVLRPEVRLRFYGFKVLRVMRTFDLALSRYIRTGGRVLGRRPLCRPARFPRGVPRLGPAPSRPPGRPGRPRGAPNVDPRPKDREGGEGCRNRQDGGGPKVPPPPNNHCHPVIVVAG